MRRFLALCCCAAYLAFGLVAGAAHVHQAADHHEEMRGLHLDHAHLGETPADHNPTSHHEPSPAGHDQTQLDAWHIGHHEGDALYLTVTARRSLDSELRVLPAMVAVGAAIHAPARVSVRHNQLPDHLRGPPRSDPTPSRAPPA